MEYLSQQERAVLKARRLAEPFADETLRQLDHIYASHTFKRIQQHAKDFLGFIVAQKLLGQDEGIKETTIAIHAFGESANYSPAERSTVRVAAGTLRQKLADYYTEEGRADPIEIVIPQETYVPEIRDRRASVAISVFENWNPRRGQDHLCRTVSDEIAHRLTQVGALQAERVDALEDADKHLAYGLRGSLECRDDLMRLNVSLSDLHAGQIVFGQAFEGKRDDLFKLSAKVATAIVTALRPEMAAGLRSGLTGADVA
jgi:TolB-like protein